MIAFATFEHSLSLKSSDVSVFDSRFINITHLSVPLLRSLDQVPGHVDCRAIHLTIVMYLFYANLTVETSIIARLSTLLL